MHRFIAPSAQPKATATRRSPTERPRTRGRQIATRISAANALRPKAAPAGPSSSNSSTANAAPTWSEATASRTRPAAGSRGACAFAGLAADARGAGEAAALALLEQPRLGHRAARGGRDAHGELGV